METYTTEPPSAVTDSNRTTAQAASDAATLAKEKARSAIAAGHAYARDAVNAAGQQLSDAKVQLNRAAEQGAAYVAQQPVRAMMVAAAGGALLGALRLRVMRIRR